MRKIRAGVNALGNTQILTLMLGQEFKVTTTPDLVESVAKPNVVNADKGYNSNNLVSRPLAQFTDLQIPSLKNAKKPRQVGHHFSKARTVVE